MNNNDTTEQGVFTIAPSFEGKVKFELIDAVTGKVLQTEELGAYFDTLKDNTATYDARKAHVQNCIPGNDQFKMTRIEWGWGSAATDRSQTDLSGPFATSVFTPIDAYTSPTADGNVLQMTSLLSTEALTFPSPEQGGPVSPSYPYIREVALRSSPTTDYPKGLMYARFVSDADIPKTTSRINIRITWFYVFF